MYRFHSVFVDDGRVFRKLLLVNLVMGTGVMHVAAGWATWLLLVGRAVPQGDTSRITVRAVSAAVSVPSHLIIMEKGPPVSLAAV